MSASAGRVLIIPRGEYNSETTYQMLDLVRYGSGTFICKKTSLGNTPDYEQDTEYWQLLVLSGDVAGVKGDAEEEYRRGLVNIDYDDLGIDSELSSVSDLPLKNKAIKAALDEKQDDIGIDDEPTAYSDKLVYSGGVDKAIKNLKTSFVSYDSMSTTDKTGSGMTTGDRNLLNNTLTTSTTDGVTFTKNIDDSVTLSGTASADGYKTLGTISLGEGTFKVTQADEEGDKATNLLGDLYVFDGSDNVLAYTSDEHNSFTLLSAATVTVKIKYTDTTVYDDKRIYPMVRIGYEINDNYESFYTLMPTFNSGERNSTLFSRISALFNNVRKLWNTVGTTALASGKTVTGLLGNTDISGVGSTVTGAISNLQAKLLWTNSSPTSSFAGQTVGVDLTPYKFVIITFKATKSSDYYYSETVAKGLRAYPQTGFNNTESIFRRETTPTDTGVTFSGCFVWDIKNYNAFGNNDYMIPYQIYGIK